MSTIQSNAIGVRGQIFNSAAPWLYVIFSEALVPLVASLVAALLLFDIPQSQEVLLGLLEPSLKAYSELNFKTSQQISIWPLCWLLAMTVVFSLLVWYTARLLVTIEADRRRPASLCDVAAEPALLRAIEDVPRLLGSAAGALVIASFISAQRKLSDEVVLCDVLALLATLVPVLCVYGYQRFGRDLWLRKSRPVSGLTVAVVLALASFTGEFFVVSRIGLRPYVPSVVLGLSVLTLLPAAMLIFTTWRRAIWARMFGGKKLPSATTPMEFDRALRRLVLIALGSLISLAALGFANVATVRPFGSASVVLLFLCSALGVLTSSALVLRHLARGLTGVALLAAVPVLLYVVLHGESLGHESLESKGFSPAGLQPLQDASTTSKDIVVNAYGGGLRAGVFAALLLADLDDQSCGNFGKRLHSLSGVSGGSLGIAVYLAMRQDFVAAGGWGTCTPASSNTRPLRALVEDALIQDHLSAVLARLLTLDILPGPDAHRGQALIDSWQDGVLTSLKRKRTIGADTSTLASLGLARPLTSLNGGMSPSATVYLNSTDVDTGHRVWMSNRGQVGDSPGAMTALNQDVSVVQAVLHSARFPVVSPAGAMQLSRAGQRMIDGGYADNSGAATLADQVRDQTVHIWLDIDGNPTTGTCGESATADRGFRVWSGLEALLEVRTAQAQIAVDRFIRTRPEILHLPIGVDLDEALKDVIIDPVSRCNQVRRSHNAPLGWYMTQSSIESMSLPLTNGAAKACRAMAPLCQSTAPSQ